MYRLSAFYVARTASDLPMVRPATVVCIKSAAYNNMLTDHSPAELLQIDICAVALMVCYSAQDCTIPSLFLIIVYSMAALRQAISIHRCAAGVLPFTFLAVSRPQVKRKRLVIWVLCRRTAGGFFANWAANMLVQLVAQAFGLLIGATVMDPKAAQVRDASNG
jgi:hypothetical protein